MDLLGLGGGIGNFIAKEIKPGGLINTVIGKGKDAVSSLTNKQDNAVVKSQVSKTAGATSTSNTSHDEAKAMPGGSYNVLNDYRSYTYQWTLACLGKDALKNPKGFKNSSLDFVVARSGGKNEGMKVPSAKTKVAPAKPAPNNTSTQYEELVDTVALVSDFNKTSPGRFDLFIDSVDMECILAPGEKQGNSVATNIKFEVLEPYSLNGFIEALYVSAVSAGYDGYLGTPYLLKLEFQGYPDSDYVGEPVDIPNSSRYFVFIFTEVGITVTEQGTKYTCSGVPSNEMAFSLPDTLLTDMKMEGPTVGEVLDNLFDNLNKSVQEQAKAEKKEATIDDCDEYEIHFPPPVDTYPSPAYKLSSATVAKNSESPLAKATMANFLTNNAVMKMVEPEKKSKPAGGTKGTTEATAGDTGSADKPQDQGMKYEPKASVIQFSQGSHISDIITAVIRDSNYLVDIIKDVKKAADKNGMVTYFMIQINIIPKNKDDSASGRPLNKYQYIVIPWKVHFSKLAMQKNVTYEPGSLDELVNRDYNYYYTGKNVDVLNFQIKFNNLFYQATPPKSGNTENQEQTTASVPNGEDKATKDKTESPQTAKKQTGKVAEQASPVAADTSKQPQAGAKRTDPYLQFAQAAHNAIMESVDQVQGEVEIIGDPYYLVMGGMGNETPDLAKPGLTTAGSADHQGGQVLIKLSFNNPIDIDEKSGEMLFRKDVSYSGVYNVIDVKSHFKDGKFTQNLNILRLSGQKADSDKDVKVEEPTKLAATPKPGGSPTTDTAQNVDKAGARPSSFDLSKMLSRGQLGITLPTLPGGTGLSAAAALGAADALLKNVTGSANSFAKSIPADITNAASKLTSGSLSSNNASSLLPSTDSLIATAKSVGTNAMAQVSSLKDSAAGLINGAQDKVDALTKGLPSDPKASMAKLGLDTSALAGLDPSLQSKVAGQLADITKNVPAEVDLDAAKASGLSLANISGSALQNIPATAKKLVAELPELPDVKVNSAQGAELLKQAEATAAKMGLKIPSMPTLGSGGDIAGQLGSAQKLLGGVTDSLPSVEGAMKMASNFTGEVSNLSKSVAGQFGSISASTSPLSKLMSGTGNPNAAPYTGTDPIVRARLGLPPIDEA